MQSPERPKRQDGVSSEKQWPVCKSLSSEISFSTTVLHGWCMEYLPQRTLGWIHSSEAHPSIICCGDGLSTLPGAAGIRPGRGAAPRLQVAVHCLFVLNLPQLTRRLSLHCSACITKKAVRLYFSWERNRISGCVFAGTQIPHIQRAGTEPPPTHGTWFLSNLQWMWLLAKSRQLFYKQVHLCIFSQLPCDRVGKCTCK